MKPKLQPLPVTRLLSDIAAKPLPAPKPSGAHPSGNLGHFLHPKKSR